jgi:anti-sigma regulatory factor (Ser/Thr protein kinase)
MPIMSAAPAHDAAVDPPLMSHGALLYRSTDDYLDGILPFVQDGLAAETPVLIAVPAANLELLHDSLPDATEVTYADMRRVGRNPARIIPAVQHFLDTHPARRVRFVGEPMWSDRSAPERIEAVRHEAMLNTAFADVAVDMLCPYDADALSPAVIADAWRTHPFVVDGADRCRSAQFTDPTAIYAADDHLLPDPPADAATVAITADDLTAVRGLVGRFATEAGLGSRRVHELVLAVNEITTNTVVHTPAPGTLRIWSEDDTVICEIRDRGHIADAFAGRRMPGEGADHGRGIWMANHLCDLVQLRSTSQGTTIRLHIERGRS